MLLNKYLPRRDFDSYEDFKQNYKVNIPEDFNFAYDVVDEWGKAEPEKLALVWCDDHDNEKKITFSELSRLSNKAANFFVRQGIKKGDKVMLILRRRYEYWITAVALHKIGAVLIPATLQLVKKDIVYRANAANIKMIVCVDDAGGVATQVELAVKEAPSIVAKALVAGKREGWIDYASAIDAESDIFPRPTGENATKSTDTMLIYFTSGTTGMPKMAMHSFSYPLGFITTAKYWQRVQENKLHMSVSDSGWAKFGWGKIYGQWICGATIFAYDMDKFIPANLLSKLEKYKVTTFCAPPTMYRFMLQEDITKYDLSSIKNAAIAGEPLNPEVFNKFKELTGISLREGFGQTETSVILGNFEWFEPRPGSTGKPSPLYDVDIVDEEGNSCEDGEEGEIVIRNINESVLPGITRGYYKSEELTSELFKNGMFHTGDLAWRDSDGYYWFVGRNDDVIKCSGYRIGPFEVESALIEHDAVVECAITAVPDPVRGQVVKATIVLASGYTPSDELVRELQNHVKRATAPYKYPRIVEFTDELPKTVGGKIKRALIRRNDSQN